MHFCFRIFLRICFLQTMHIFANQVTYTGEEVDIGKDEYEAAIEELQVYKIKQQGKKGKGHGTSRD